MIIDISSYNGIIDFKKMGQKENVERIILRGTTKNGMLDTRLIENINKIIKLEELDGTILDVYKFSYALNYGDAATEANELIGTLKAHGLINMFSTLWLDIEPINGRTHSKQEAAAIIAAYNDVCKINGVKMGIYCNYSYLTTALPEWAQIFDIWLARWSSSMGDCNNYNVVLWQYTNTGKCAGIKGDVDISRTIKK